MSENLRTRFRRITVAVVLLACAAGAVAFVIEGAGSEEFVDHLLLSPVLLAYPVVAGIILWRRPHPIGYLLLGMGFVLAANDVATPLLDRPTPPGTSVPWRVVLLAATTPFPIFAMLLPTLGFRFPDGRPLSARWRIPEAMYAVGVACVVTGMFLSPTIKGGEPGDAPTWELANPLSNAATEAVRPVLELVALGTLLPAIILAVAAVVVRFRRARGVERQQLRWLTAALLTVLLSWPLVAGAAKLLAGETGGGLVSSLYVVAVFAVPPFGMGVAITRYRLYDLDRIIRRTVAYAIVTLVLAGLYAGAVLGLGSALRPMVGGDSDVVVALSTLMVAAAFQPVRRRVQSVVDRRFNRARYDAQRTSEAFAQRLRDQVDLGEVRGDLATTVRRSLAPTTIGVWLPEEAAP